MLSIFFSAPNSTITTVHVIRMSKRSATLDWESPDCNLRYGRLISYRYELHHVYNDTTHSRVVSRFTNETDVTFTDLVPNNLYSFSVAFMTDHGQSSMSNAVQFSTHPDGMEETDLALIQTFIWVISF